MHWAAEYQDGSVKGIGAIEVLGAIGLVLPLATGIAAVLTPLAALAMAAVMIGAAVVHIRRHEPPTPAIVLGALSIASAVLVFIVLA